MEIKLDGIPGFELFETAVEKERIKYLLKFLSSIFAQEQLKWILPNMGKDASGKIITTGFHAFYETVLVEFRNFISNVDFDSAKYDIVKNIRVEARNFGEDGNPKIDSIMTIKILHSLEPGFYSLFTVIGEKPCSFVLRKLEDLQKLLK